MEPVWAAVSLDTPDRRVIKNAVMVHTVQNAEICVVTVVTVIGVITSTEVVQTDVSRGCLVINVIPLVFLVGMVQTAQTNVAYTVTAVTDLMGTVNLDVRLDGKEDTANKHVMGICMGRIVRKNVVLVCALNNVTTSMEHVYMDVTRDSMDLNVLKNVQTDRMDTTVNITVAAIVRSLEYVTE